MENFALSCLVLLLLLTLIAPAYASVEVRAAIGEVVHVVFNFGKITDYEEIKSVITERTIPEAIVSSLGKRNLTDVQFNGELLDFDDAEKAVTASFSLLGSDIVEFTFSTETLRRELRVNTDWRKFELNLTERVSLNFSEYFGTPLSSWEFESETYPTYYHNHTGAVPFDPACYFILPKEATEIRVEDTETIVFELPASLGESLLNSPYLIFGGIIVAIIVASVYRSVRKSEKGELES